MLCTVKDVMKEQCFSSLLQPSFFLVQEWLTSMGIKYYESKMNLNWKPILKNITEVRKI